MSAKKVVVIGAGCAGLSAAYTLRKQGLEVVVFESSQVAGGRCRNVKRDGFNISLGAGMTEPQWKTTFQYLGEMGMLDQVYVNNKQRYGFWKGGKKHYVEMGNLGEMLRFRGLPFKTYPQMLKLGLSMYKYIRSVNSGNHDFSALMELSQYSTAEYVLQHGGAEALDRVLSPFIGTMILARPQEVTIAHPIALTALMSGMCMMKEGMGSITAALYERVKESVQFDMAVKKVVIEDKKVKGVETKDGFVEADQVICATDAVLARQIIPDLPETMRKPLETCQYSSTYNYVFALEKRITPDHFLSLMIPASENSILTTIFDEGASPMAATPPGTGLMHCFTAGWHDKELMKLSDEERRKVVIRETQKFYPDFPDHPYFTECPRYDRAVNLEAPGQFPAIQELLKSHMRDVKGLYLAGEYLFLIACTEGALATGRKAAEMVIADH